MDSQPVASTSGRSLKDIWGKIVRWEYSGLCFLVAFVSALHFSIITQPTYQVFDEGYYVPEALSILQGKGITNPQQPPLGKLFVVSGIFLFGDNPFGWRFFSVLFGIICVALFYLVCRQLRLSKQISLVAAFLFTTENLSFVMGSLAMLDVFCLAFMLAAFYFYLKGHYKLSGLAIGLAALTKLPGALVLAVIVLHWLFTGRKEKRQFLLSMLVAPLSFLLLLPLFDLAASHQLINPITHIRDMLASNNLTFSAAALANYDPFGVKLSRPWEWILHNNRIDYATVFNQGKWVTATYLFLISPTVWVLIIPSVIIMFIKSLKRNSGGLFALCWFAVTYLFWVAITLIMDRTTYVYYFYPTIGAVCIGIAMGWDWLLNLKGKAGIFLIAVALGYLLICLYTMAITLPGSLWIKIPFSAVIFTYVFYYLSKKRDAKTQIRLSN